MKITNKAITKTRQIHEPIENVWNRWTTHEGLKTFFGSDNSIELTPNGKFEIYFVMDNPVGLRGSEGCQILSFLPSKMLSFTWNAPPQFKEVRVAEYKTWVVIEFESIDGNNTLVKLVHLGWPEKKKWTEVFAYFNVAWDSVLNELVRIASKESRN